MLISNPVAVECESSIGKSKILIDVETGTAVQTRGNERFHFALESYVFEKKSKKKKVVMDVQGRLVRVENISTGKDLDVTITESKLSLNAELPIKDKKKFTAHSFELMTNLRFSEASHLRLADKTHNSTSCVLIRGGKVISQMNKNNSLHIANTYKSAEPQINNEERVSGKEISETSTKEVPAESSATQK